MPDKTKPPIFNSSPFKKIKVPDSLYNLIQDEYKKMTFSQVIDDVVYEPEYKTHTCGGISVKGTTNPYHFKDNISKELYDECYKIITPIVEEWCGVKLEHSWAYGVRSYTKNSILHLHRDRIDTHIISCIIYVDQNSEINWPLDFYDHDNKHHQVIFDYGDMLLYESLCVHGRETPFQGQYYRNMYFHWKPVDWDPSPYKNMKTSFRNGNQLLNYYV